MAVKFTILHKISTKCQNLRRSICREKVSFTKMPDLCVFEPPPTDSPNLANITGPAGPFPTPPALWYVASMEVLDSDFGQMAALLHPGAGTLATFDYTPYWAYLDQLGTPVMLTNTDGNAVWEATFAPFGETVSVNEDPDGDGTAVTMNIRMPGQYYDAETGLNYNWHRFYDPAVGRYLHPEAFLYDYSIAQPSRYAENNPLKGTDHNGYASNCRPVDENSLNEWIDIANGNTMCTPNCNPEYYICDDMPVGTQAETHFPFGSHTCRIFLNSKYFIETHEFPEGWGDPINTNDRGCILAHEYCHQRPEGRGDECMGYRSLEFCEVKTNGTEKWPFFRCMREYYCTPKDQRPPKPKCPPPPGRKPPCGH